MRTELRLEMLSRILRSFLPPNWYCVFTVSSSQKTGFYCSCGALQWFIQWNPVLDHYHAERLGTKYKDQSTTEIETSSHGSEVCNCRVQRDFFFLSWQDHDRGYRRSQLQLHYEEKKPLAPRVVSERPFANIWKWSHFKLWPVDVTWSAIAVQEYFQNIVLSIKVIIMQVYIYIIYLSWFGTKIAQKYAKKGSKYSSFRRDVKRHVLTFSTSGQRPISSPELRSSWPAVGKRELWEQPLWKNKGNNRILVIRLTAHLHLWRMPEMVAPRARVFRPLVKGNEALGTRLGNVRSQRFVHAQ